MPDIDDPSQNQLGQTAVVHKFISDVKVQNDVLMKPRVVKTYRELSGQQESWTKECP